MDLPILNDDLGENGSRARRPHEEKSYPQIVIDELDQVWFQVAGTRCNLECNHCFISCSPKNKSFGFLSLDDVERYLQESETLGVKEFYFTGGEPFLNPDMTEILVRTLEFGAATVLSNGTVFRESWLSRLKTAEINSRYSLEFRISIDGFDASTNDPIRGKGTFDRAIAGLQQLVQRGFLPIITAVRTWSEADDENILGHFVETLNAIGYQRPRIKLLPTLLMGAEENRNSGYTQSQRITHQMMQDFDPSHLVCHNSRLVSDRGVHVCPILLESPDSLMGQTLSASLRPFELKHGACFTCYQFGAICSNSASRMSETIRIQK